MVIVDEAAMLDTRITGELLTEARKSGAKLILAGDDRQLASIERGGLFTELKQRHGAAEISEVIRQQSDWQRQAARDLAEGRFAEAVTAFDRAGAITWTEDHVDARAALVAAWKHDTAADPAATRFVFAYANRDMDALNAELRKVRRERGELAGPDARFVTKHGLAHFAPGDRVQFTDTLKPARIYNGNVGTITAIDAESGTIRARLDAAAGQPGREVVWSAAEFDGFRHGYAGTIYKGQGKTLDHTYLYHTHHWRAAASYVALTRQRESAQVFVARETARDAVQLARQMVRAEIKAASVAWATREELAPELRQRAQQDQRTESARQTDAAEAHSRPEQAYWRRMITQPPVANPIASLRERAAVAKDLAASADLIPAFIDPAGRDSLGRGLDAASIAVVVTKDYRVQQERAALVQYLRGAYRDPIAAKAQLDEMVKSQGLTSTAARLAPDPEQLGPLRGKLGFFAGARARAERATAERVATAVVSSLDRLARAENKAAQAYRSSVEAQRQADAVVIPKLSDRAEAVVARLTMAPDDTTRAAVWREMTADADVAWEVAGFRAAVRQRFGDDAVRAMRRSYGGSIEAPSVRSEHRAALGVVSRTVHVLSAGEFARESQERAERLAQRQALGRGLGR